jgi:dUTP pyrophosphatase
MNEIRVYFNRLSEDATIPTYGSFEAAGCDLYAAEEAQLEPGDIEVIHCGFSMEFPKEMEAQIRPRSGMAIKEGLTVVNSPGTIDSDYRGEIMVGMINVSKTTKIINKGDRIAQMVFVPVYKAHFLETTNGLSNTVRGTDGFGSTGRR